MSSVVVSAGLCSVFRMNTTQPSIIGFVLCSVFWMSTAQAFCSWIWVVFCFCGYVFKGGKKGGLVRWRLLGIESGWERGSRWLVACGLRVPVIYWRHHGRVRGKWSVFVEPPWSDTNQGFLKLQVRAKFLSYISKNLEIIVKPINVNIIIFFQSFFTLQCYNLEVMLRPVSLCDVDPAQSG